MKRIKIISLLIVAIFFLGNIKFAQGFEREGKIHKNIYVKNIDLSNLTKDEAKNKINTVLEGNKEIKLKFNEENYKINLKELDINYNVNEVVEQAYNIDRNNTLINDIKTKLNLDLGHKQVLKLNYQYNDEKLNTHIEDISNKLYISPINATIKIENGLINTTEETCGRTVDKIKLKNEIIYKIKNIYEGTLEIPIQNIEAKYNIKQLSQINTVLGTYETYFNPKIANRVNNIRIAADATKNILIDNGEEFSFNSILLSSNLVKDMKEAPVIVNGKVEKGLGGGICQVSSTIYNAALYSGMDISDIKNHSIPSAYTSKGRDATVSLGDVDFKFINKFNTPILIYNEVFDNRIVSTIYGNKEDKKEIEIITETIETLPNKVVEKNSGKFYKGERIVEQDGRIGYKVNTFRVYKSEKDIRKEFVYESFYPPRDKVIIYGTKAKEIQNNEILNREK